MDVVLFAFYKMISFLDIVLTLCLAIYLSTDPSIYRSAYFIDLPISIYYFFMHIYLAIYNFLFTVFKSLLSNKEFIWMTSEKYIKYQCLNTEYYVLFA